MYNKMRKTTTSYKNFKSKVFTIAVLLLLYASPSPPSQYELNNIALLIPTSSLSFRVPLPLLFRVKHVD